MTREDILHMAQEAGWETPLTWDETDGFFQRLERFAALVSAAEREPFTEAELEPIRRRMMMEACNAADNGDSERYNALKVMANDVLDILLGVKK